MGKIADRLWNCGRRAGLVPFVTAGFPCADSTVPMLHALARAGADVIEVGVPFSDPMADGAAIQRASEGALGNGMSLVRVLDQCAQFRQENVETPVVLMGYANSFVNFGDGFANAAAAAGVNGVIVVDLADVDRVVWRGRLDAVGVDLVGLVAPTTRGARMREIAAEARGFVYFISLCGVTGAAHLQAGDIVAQAREVKAAASVPLAVGFGVRDAVAASAVAEFADAVVVGSVLIEAAEGCARAVDAPEAVGRVVRGLAEALR